MKHAIARALSIALFPLVLVALDLLVVAGVCDGTSGLTAAAAALVVAVGVPFAIIWVLVRRGTLPDMDVSTRRHRPAVLAMFIATTLAAVAILAAAHASPQTIAVLVSAVVVAALSGLASLRIKSSLHVCTAAGSVVALACVVGWKALALTPAVLALAWARKQLKAHTVAELVLGAALGIVGTLAVFALETA